MITTITTTLVTPFMVATTAEAPAAPAPQIEAVAYDWSSQKASTLEEDSCNASSYASFSTIPGTMGQQCVDDWHLA